MSNFDRLKRTADENGNLMMHMGFGLKTIGNLLGADGHEHHLSDDDLHGLAHAVVALSACAIQAGMELCDAAEMADAPPVKTAPTKGE